MEYPPKAVKHAVSLGSDLLQMSGSVEKAARVLNQERVALLGNHLSFTRKGMSSGSATSLIEMAQQGVPSRREAAPARELAKNHGSVRGHEDELMQKAWKDAAYGAALMVDPEIPRADTVMDVRISSGTSAQTEPGPNAFGRAPNQRYAEEE